MFGVDCFGTVGNKLLIALVTLQKVLMTGSCLVPSSGSTKIGNEKKIWRVAVYYSNSH